MTPPPAQSPIDQEIQRVTQLTRSMIDEYLAWGAKIQYANTMNAIYGDLIDFVNFRVETVESCLDLIRDSKIADSLGLCRSLLENYLLFILMIRGNKYFRVSDGTMHSSEKFFQLYADHLEYWKQAHESGDRDYPRVKIFKRKKKHLIHIYEGILFDNGELIIPYHFFQFSQFRPQTMRLNHLDYFEYYELDDDTKSALKEHRIQSEMSYQYYLSYAALLECLQLNEITSEKQLLMIEAHYTFLGQFLHPTHNAARDLHDRSNVFAGEPNIGMKGDYSKISILLSSVYTCYLLAGYLDEIMTYFEAAPALYFSSPGTSDLRALTATVPTSIPYFWFIFNEAPLYDRFNWAVHHLSDEELAGYGNYANVPTHLIDFNLDVHSNFQAGMRTMHNGRVGTYNSPV